MSQARGQPRGNPFVREGHVDKAGIVGSHWWNKELAQASVLRSRRNVLVALALSAGGIATLGLAAFAIADTGTREEQRRALDVQRDLGWSFGATSETVAFDALYTTTYARDALPRLVSDLTPRSEALRPWFQPALFQAPEALPRVVVPGATVTPTRLAEALRPIRTPAMIVAEAAGLALAELLAKAGERVAVIFDLAGPESVAAAAGAAGLLEPVFLFDNWPHPRGVVKAHLTLAAAVYHQPRFAQARSERRPAAPPAFVLDRDRLAAYTDDAAQFDNRWLAKLPLVSVLVGLEIKHVLYVVASQTTPIDLRDVGQAMHQWSEARMDVRALALDAFVQGADGKLHFGGSAEAEATFFGHYPWKSPAPAATPVAANFATAAWRAAAAPVDPADKTVGMVAVEVDEQTGTIVGLRSGSWNRASGGGGGG